MFLLAGFGAGCHALGQGRGTLGVLGERDPRVLYSVPVEERVVALTLDDGPDAATTPRILELLAEHGARATFFLITSRIDGCEDVVSSIPRRGHEIDNHLTRDEPSIELTRESFARELRASHDALSLFAEPRWFRPGSGRYDDEMLDVVDAHGYRTALGSIYPLDAQIPSSWFARRVILAGLEPGAVIILHDGGGRGERTIATLAALLPELRARGYRVVTLSQLDALRSPAPLAK